MMDMTKNYSQKIATNITRMRITDLLTEAYNELDWALDNCHKLQLLCSSQARIINELKQQLSTQSKESNLSFDWEDTKREEKHEM